MKQIFTSILVALTMLANAATPPLTLTTTYAQLIGAGPAVAGTSVDKDAVAAAHQDVQVIITGVAALADMATFTYATDHAIAVASLNPQFDTNTHTYTLTITAVVNLVPAGGATAFAIKKADGTLIWSVDIRSALQQVVPPGCDQIAFQNTAESEFNMHILPQMKTKFGIQERTGAYIDAHHVVHLFVDNFGKYYGYGAPTVATEQYSYQVHILTADCLKASYNFDFTGAYNPQFNIDSNSPSSAKAQSNPGGITILVKDCAVIGPFTDKFSFNLTRNVNGKSETVVNPTIPVAKMYYVSVTIGLLGTTLKNPQNISKAPLNKTGDTTLIADDPKTRGLLSIMAIYYPSGRSFLFPPSGGPFDISRIGIVVGTQVGDSANQNFLLGLSHDFARGGAFTYGIHFGDRNVVSGAPNFKYGTDKFTLPELNVKKAWNVGFFFGVSIDTRVALQLIKSLGTSL
jgi:hypothetical protein